MKLAILGDGTLVKPKSGHTFVQHPEDQELLPGVEKAIAALVEQGYVLAIASNQGGCMTRECFAKDAPIGAYVEHLGRWMRVSNKADATSSTSVHARNLGFPDPDRKTIILYIPGFGTDSRTLFSDELISFRYKTVQDAIAEMRYCLDLLPSIKTAYFCPDDGWWCHIVRQPDFYSSVSAGHHECKGFEFRKPGSGMLTLAIRSFDATEAIMIGDRPEDYQAAKAAGIGFLDAYEWRSHFV